MRYLLPLLLFCVSSFGQSFTPFTWPVSNAGPYTVASTLTSTTVFFPNGETPTENDLATHRYSHHTRIWNYQGTTWLAFSSSGTNESDSGTQTVISHSTDHGLTWSAPGLVVPSQSAWNAPGAVEGIRMVFPRNFQLYDGTNYLVTAVDEYNANIHAFGIALFACPVYTDGTIGSLFRISTNSYTPKDGASFVEYNSILGPPLMAYSKVYGCWGNSGADASGENLEWMSSFYQYDPITILQTEPNTFSVDGSETNLYRIWRGVSSYSPECSNCPLFLWQQRSTNSGVNWSTNELQTAIPNTPSESVGRRLSTGQYVIVGNPQMYVQGVSIWRDPLFMAISEPGTTTITNVTAIRQGLTGTPTYAGNFKGGGAQYPDCQQVGNYLYVSYSMQKESIGFSRVLIPGLEDNNNDYQESLILKIGTLYLPR